MAPKKAAPKKGTKKGGKEKEVPLTGEALFEKQLATVGLADALQIADHYEQVNYKVTTTG
jgi:hypothetical protein